MKKFVLLTMAVAAVGLSACSSTNSAQVDQAPYAHERTVGSTGEPVFHHKQGK